VQGSPAAAAETRNPPASRRFAMAVALALVLGAVPRLWRLPAQLVGGDEMHSVRVLLSRSWREILTTYQQSDPCIPLTALSRAWMDLGVPLSESLLQAPVVLAGLLALAILPWLASAVVSRATAAAFAFALALSPQLVWYSRIARPYLPAVLLTALAALAFARFHRASARAASGDRASVRAWLGPGLAYCLAASAAAWLLPPAAPAVVAPLLCGMAALFPQLRRSPRPSLVPIAAVTAGLAVAVAVWLLPALSSFLALAESKRVAQEVPAAVWTETLRLLAGADSPGVAALFWALALLGLVGLVRERRGLGVALVAIVCGQAIAIRWLSPMGLGNPLILARYLLPVLPIVLLGVAHALTLLWQLAAPGRVGGGATWRFAGRAATGACAAVLVLAGPLVERDFWRTSYLGHNDWVRFTLPRAEVPPEFVPRIYRRLADELPPGAVIEALWPSGWAPRTPAIYQQIHGREVLLAVTDVAARVPNARWRNLLAPTPQAILASRARYLVLHRDPLREEAQVRRGGMADPGVFPEGYRQVLADLPRLVRSLRRALGRPLLDDEAVVVWDLYEARLRKSRRPAQRPNKLANKR
jgi:hypothetical protein